MDFPHRTWVEIDLDRLLHNAKTVRQRLDPGTKLMAVVKANAYGHGAKPCALLLEQNGVDSFGVFSFQEAKDLRRAGVRKPILVLGHTAPEQVRLLADLDVEQTVIGPSHARQLQNAAKKAGVRLKVHLKIDTGMSRLGFLACDKDQAVSDLLAVCALPSLDPVGVFTHFAVADEQTAFGRHFTEMQHTAFAAIITRLQQQGVTFREIHCCNSAGTYFYPEAHHTMVRSGIFLYGLSPTGHPPDDMDLLPVMSLQSLVSMVKDIPAGCTISYGCTAKAQKSMQIATVPVGYANGYPRRLGNKAYAFSGGHLLPIVGTICMDQLMLDVSGLSIRPEDRVTFFGGDSPLSLHNLAGLSGTIAYELCCGISGHTPRLYRKDGAILKTASDMRFL